MALDGSRSWSGFWFDEIRGQFMVKAGELTQRPKSIQQRYVWLSLLVIIFFSLFLNVPRVSWLIGVGESSEFSFHPDVGLFVKAASQFRNPDIGYPIGWPVQLYLTHGLVRLYGDVGFLELLRLLNIVYSCGLVLLTYLIGLMLLREATRALLASAILSLTPMHLVNSAFGSVDAIAVFYFYATCYATAKYVISCSLRWLVLAAGLSGGAMAIKLFVPALVPMVLLLLGNGQLRILDRLLVICLSSLGGFAGFSLLNFTIWDLQRVYWMLKFDNLKVTGGESFLSQSWLYLSTAPSALGLPVFAGVLLGAIAPIARRWATNDSEVKSNATPLSSLGREQWITPTLVFAIPLAFHALLICIAQVHMARHIYVFLPILCIIAVSWFEIGSGTSRGRVVGRWFVGLVVSVYMIAGAFSIGRIYRDDLRVDLKKFVAEKRAGGRSFYTLNPYYSKVRGVEFVSSLEQVRFEEGHVLLSCDLEYSRYFKSDDAKQIFHSYGQDRVDFYRKVLVPQAGNHEGPEVLANFRSNPLGIELHLIDLGYLRPIGTSVPRQCVALGKNLGGKGWGGNAGATVSRSVNGGW